MWKLKYVSVCFLIFNCFDQLLLLQSFLNDSKGGAASLFYISIRTSFQILVCISLSWSDGHLGQLFLVSLLSLRINLCEKWDKLVYLNMFPLPCCDLPENACNHCSVIFGGEGKGIVFIFEGYKPCCISVSEFYIDRRQIAVKTIN